MEGRNGVSLEGVPLYAAVPANVWEFPIGGEYVVVRPELPSLFYLNATAALIWRVYGETGVWERAADSLVKMFGIPREAAVQDVTATLRDWTSTGLLGPVRAAAPPVWNGTHGPPIVIAHCSIEGTRFALLTDSREVTQEVAPRLDEIRIEPGTPDFTIAVWNTGDGLFALVAGEECIAVEQGARAARAVLLQELVRHACPGRQWMALLHAGACGTDGRCVLFPASSFSGKSTLAAALMASGFALYSDDFVGIEAGSLRIPPMPFAIAVRRGSWDVLRDWIPAIEEAKTIEGADGPVKLLPVSGGSAPGEAVAIVFTEWVAGAEVRLEKLSMGDVIARLHESGFWVCHERSEIGGLISWLDGLPKYALRYGELAEAVEEVKSIVNFRAAPERIGDSDDR